MAVEHVFKALADPHRRHLCAKLPMTRFGVMKHLHALEEAGLITTSKVGRVKRHYLNPGPIRDVAAWVEQYRRFWDERLDRLEDLLRELQHKEQSNDHDEP